MTTLTETQHPAAFVVSEASGTRSRDPITLAAGLGFVEAGAVLGQLANGTYTPLAPAASNGSEIAAAILHTSVTVGAAAAPAVAYVRDAEINGAELIWPAAITEPQTATALGQLAARGLIAR